MGAWTGTGFPADKAADWASSKTPVIWLLTVLYLFVVVVCPQKIPVLRLDILPHWYRWNGIFQMVLLFAFIPEMLTVLINGWTESVCRAGNLYSGSFSGTIVMLFVISKVVDLAETMMILMEGRSPLVLHIFHHAVTLLYVWHSYLQQGSVARWFVFANLAAHVVLYSYLSPKKFGLRPCWLLVAIAQMMQLVVCLLVTVTAQRVINAGGKCDVNAERLPLDKLICIVFIVLFADFYHQKIRQMRLQRDFEMAREIRSQKSHPAFPDSDSPRAAGKKSCRPCGTRVCGMSRTGITPSGRSYLSSNSK